METIHQCKWKKQTSESEEHMFSRHADILYCKLSNIAPSAGEMEKNWVTWGEEEREENRRGVGLKQCDKEIIKGRL